MDSFSLLPEVMVQHIASFLWVNDAINFRRTCKRHASLAEFLVDSKIRENGIHIWLRAIERPQNRRNRMIPIFPKYRNQAMTQGLETAFEHGNLEAADFFWKRGADLTQLHSYLIAKGDDRLRVERTKLVEYAIHRGGEDTLNAITRFAAENGDILLMRRCIQLGATSEFFRKKINIHIDDFVSPHLYERMRVFLRMMYCSVYVVGNDATKDDILEAFDDEMKNFLPVPDVITEEHDARENEYITREKRKRGIWEEDGGGGGGDAKERKSDA